MKHTCKALLLRCIDFRFGGAIKRYLEGANLMDDCDMVAVAGAGKNISMPKEEADKSFILRQIEISKNLHDIEEVIIMNHTDCGAYGGHEAFDSEAAEEQFHWEEMERAKAAILAHFPGKLEVKCVLAKINDGGQIKFEQPA